MATFDSVPIGTRIVVVGGGFAGVETMLALRALAGDHVRLTLVSPDRVFAYRPAATLEAFDEGPPEHYDLREIADDLHATHLCARLEAVGATNKWVRLSSGGRLQYDSLVLAVGARARVGIPGALTFRGQNDVPRFRNLLVDVGSGSIKRLVFAVPAGASWPLPLYELALLSATYAGEHGLRTEVSVVTPEPTPLEMFGPEASQLVADLLSERRVRFIGNAVVGQVRRDGTVTLQFDPPIKADRVVAAPELQGVPISGIPGNWWGFVPTDAVGRVEGLKDVYAAGDVTTFPIKHGSLATQQADRIALTISAQLGIAARGTRGDRVLRARLLGGSRPLLLRTELDQFGRPRSAKLERRELDPASNGSKVFGRYLTPYLQLQDGRRRTPLPAACCTCSPSARIADPAPRRCAAHRCARFVDPHEPRQTLGFRCGLPGIGHRNALCAQPLPLRGWVYASQPRHTPTYLALTARGCLPVAGPPGSAALRDVRVADGDQLRQRQLPVRRQARTRASDERRSRPTASRRWCWTPSGRTRPRPTRTHAPRAGSRSARRTRPSNPPTRISMTRSGSSASLDCWAAPRARRPWSRNCYVMEEGPIGSSEGHLQPVVGAGTIGPSLF